MSGQRAGQAAAGISTEVVERVEAAIRDRVGSRVIEVRETVRGGGFVLQGRSRTHHVKQLAQQAAVEVGAHAREALLGRQIECRAYAYEHGIDLPEVVGWRWKGVAGA
jgi:phosphoketolase